MRIAFFTDTYRPSLNGVVTSTDTFRRELEILGHQVHIFAPASPHADREPGITRIASVPFPTEPNCRVALPVPPKLILAFRRGNFDLVHTQTPFGLGIWGAALARLFRKPLVHTYHTFFAEYAHYLRMNPQVGRAFVAQYSRIYCNRCRAIVVPSATFIEVLRSYRVTAPIRVIPTGVSIPEVLPERSEARRRLGLPADLPLLLYVGRLAREKSIDFLLEALVQLRARSGGDPRLVIVGDGPQREELEALADRLGLGGAVHWIGGIPHERVFDYYAAGDLFVFSSRTETQGLVVAEALAMGLPVVAVKGPGVCDYVSAATGGALVDPDIDTFLAEVQRLLADPELRAEAGRRGRKSGEAWSSRHQAERLSDLYAALTRRRSRRRFFRRVLARAQRRTGGFTFRRPQSATA